MKSWYIKVTEENVDILAKWKGVSRGYLYLNLIGKPGGYVRYDQFHSSLLPFGREITTEQFLEMYPQFKENNNMKEKEIIGYKLVKPEYAKIAAEIGKGQSCRFPFTSCEEVMDNRYLSLGGWMKTIRNLKEAGVLDLWFEPVFKQEETIFEFSPTFKVKVKDKQVFYKDEEITLYVKNLIDKFQSSYMGSNIGLRAFAIEEVIFKVTGCVGEPTKLSQWRELYNLIKD